MSRARVVVIGIGNSMRSDDGIGPAVVQAIGPDRRLHYDVVLLDGEPTRVIDAWRDRDLAIVCDAVCLGAPAGTIHDLTADQAASARSAGTASSHAAGLAQAVRLGTSLDRMPGALRILGIEPASMSFGPNLSPQVTLALPDLVTRVWVAIRAALEEPSR